MLQLHTARIFFISVFLLAQILPILAGDSPKITGYSFENFKVHTRTGEPKTTKEFIVTIESPPGMTFETRSYLVGEERTGSETSATEHAGQQQVAGLRGKYYDFKMRYRRERKSGTWTVRGGLFIPDEYALKAKCKEVVNGRVYELSFSKL